MTKRKVRGSPGNARQERNHQSKSSPEEAGDGATRGSLPAPTDSVARERVPHELLVVGTFAGGGIHRYIEEQVERLQGVVSVETHDMNSPPIGDGLFRFVRGFFLGVAALLSFPFLDRPDIVHVHTSHQYSFYRAAPYVLFAQYVWGVPVVLHVHGSSFDVFMETESRVVALLQRTVFAASDEIIVLSRFWKDAISVRADPDKIRVLPNAVDPATFPVSEEQTDDATDVVPHIVFVSNLVERKGVHELAGALAELGRTHPEQFTASIAGDGPLRDTIEEVATEHEEISYLGYISEKRKRSLLAEGGIYVLPTFAEGLPIAMLEGMAGSNAIVTTAVGSIPEVIGDQRGLLVEPGDVEGLTEALETLISAPEQRSKMAANNRRAIEEEYSWDRILGELLDMYDTHA